LHPSSTSTRVKNKSRVTSPSDAPALRSHPLPYSDSYELLHRLPFLPMVASALRGGEGAGLRGAGRPSPSRASRACRSCASRRSRTDGGFCVQNISGLLLVLLKRSSRRTCTCVHMVPPSPPPQARTAPNQPNAPINAMAQQSSAATIPHTYTHTHTTAMPQPKCKRQRRTPEKKDPTVRHAQRGHAYLHETGLPHAFACVHERARGAVSVSEQSWSAQRWGQHTGAA